MIRIFIGFDNLAISPYNVAQHSINMRSSQPVSFTPINLRHLTQFHTRTKTSAQSTEFSISRFLTPYLAGFEGWAIFMDNDVLCLDDIANLWSLKDEKYAVMCVKHEHIVQEGTKFLGQNQLPYPKKNWSSVMLMNCGKCRALTPEYVNTASGLDLHRFNWLESDDLIGEIPLRWNYLVDYYPTIPTNEVSMLHYTEGGPYYEDYKNCSYAKEWLDEQEDMNRCLLG